MKKTFIIILLFTSLCLWTQNVPQTIDYQGRLADSDGNYLNSVVTVDFLIYDAETGGTAIWTETQDVSCANGVFHVQLGSVTPLPETLFNFAAPWLELIVGGETLVPRTEIASVPYAIKAETAYTLQNMGSGSGLDADMLDGLNSTDFMPATATIGDITAVTAGTGLTGGGTSGDVTLNVNVPLNLNGNVSALYGIVSGVNNDNGSGVYGRHSNSGNYGILGSINYGVYGLNDPDNNYSGNFGGLGSSNYGVYGMNDISNNYGYFGSADYGVYGRNSSSGNYAYLGSSNYGVYGNHDNSSNYGFLGSYSYGVYGSNFSDYGYGVYGRTDASTGGFGVWGLNWGNGNHGYIGSTDYGVYGKHDVSNNYGFLGSTYSGVSGYSYASAGYGVYGSGNNIGGRFIGSNTGVMGSVSSAGSSTYIGVDGYSYSYGTGTYYAVYGYSGGSGATYAGYFAGNVHVTGYFSNPSDERFKENVQSFKNALSKIRLMNVYTFNFKQMEEEKRLVLPEGEQIGLIAQELEEILPELVVDNVHAYNNSKGTEGTGKDEEKIEYKGINYIGLIPVLIEAIKEQQEQIEELQQQIDDLK